MKLSSMSPKAPMQKSILYDIKGIAVKNGKIDAAQTCVNVQTLNSGIYALLIKTSDGVVNKRIIKQ